MYIFMWLYIIKSDYIWLYMIVHDCIYIYMYDYKLYVHDYISFYRLKNGGVPKNLRFEATSGVRWGWVRKKSKTLRAHLIRLTSRLGRSHHQWPCSAQVIYPVWHLKLWTPMDSGLRLRTAHNRRLWLYEPSPSYIRTAPSETQLGKVHHCRLSDVPNCPAAQLQSCSAQRLFRQQLPPIKASGKRPHIFHTLC